MSATADSTAEVPATTHLIRNATPEDRERRRADLGTIVEQKFLADPEFRKLMRDMARGAR